MGGLIRYIRYGIRKTAGAMFCEDSVLIKNMRVRADPGRGKELADLREGRGSPERKGKIWERLHPVKMSG